MNSSWRVTHGLDSIDDIQLKLAEDARIARRLYLTAVSGRRGLGISAINHCRARLGRSRLPVSLGESVPTIFGDLWPVSPRDSQRFTAAWMFLYHHLLLIDDITDGQADASPLNRSVTAYLFDDAVRMWKSCGGLTGSLASTFAESYREQIAAGQQPVGMEQFLGRRAAVVKYFASVLTAHHCGRTLSLFEEHGVESILAGFQLLDDVTDRHEDRRLLRSPKGTVDDIRGVGEKASSLLSRGVQLLGAGEDSDLARFTGNYLSRIREAIGITARPGAALPLASN